jgi:Ca2+-transporting ATPase
MVLADDNFASIVGAVEEGRIVFNNIKKVVTYLLSTNAGEILTIIATILAGLPLPLVPVQILWINLVTDSFPGLALAADPPREDVLAEPPRDPKARIVTRGVLFRIALVAIIMTIGTVWLFTASLGEEGLTKARTMAFAIMAIFQLINSFNIRSPRTSIFVLGFFSNLWLTAAVAVSLGLQVFAIHVPFMQRLFSTVPLTWQEWLIVVAVGSSILWLEELRKLIAPRLAD